MEFMGGIILTILFVAFLIAAKGTKKLYAKKLEKCTLRVPATVIDFEKTRIDARGVGASAGEKSYTYCPVYDYEINGEFYRRKSDVGVAKPKETPYEVYLMVDPEEPSDFYEEGDTTLAKLVKIFTMVDIIMGICAVLAWGLGFWILNYK